MCVLHYTFSILRYLTSILLYPFTPVLLDRLRQTEFNPAPADGWPALQASYPQGVPSLHCQTPPVLCPPSQT